MGRLHVSQAGSDRALAKMGLREESDRRWHPRPGGFWVLSLIIGALPVEKSEPTADPDVGCWHFSDMVALSGNVRSRGYSGSAILGP
jgi:hypothetical protein